MRIMEYILENYVHYACLLFLFIVSDLTLEYEEGDIYEEFKLFYEDVFPEFETIGHVTRFVVCCNYEPHLRGNVYVQFSRYCKEVLEFMTSEFLYPFNCIYYSIQ